MQDLDFLSSVATSNTPAADHPDMLALHRSHMSNYSGVSPPPVREPHMWWADTSTGILKQRNAANNGWLFRGPLDNDTRTGLNYGDPAGGAMGADTFNVADLYVQGERPPSGIAWRNVLANPAFDINQRALGTYPAGTNRYTVDRWYARANIAVALTASAFHADITNAAHDAAPGAIVTLTGTAAGATNSAFEQRTEGVTALAGRRVTLLMLMRASSGSSADVPVNVTLVRSYDDGQPVESIALGAHVATRTGSQWQLVQATYVLPTVNASRTPGANAFTSFRVIPAFPVAGDAVQLRWLALLDGRPQHVEYPFVRRPEPFELAMCRRYYESSYRLGVAPGTASTQGLALHRSQGGHTFLEQLRAPFTVPKRVTPTLTWHAPDSGTANRVQRVGGAGAANVAVTNTVHGSDASTGIPTIAGANNVAGAQFLAHWVADAEL